MSEVQGKRFTRYKNRYNAENYDSLRIVVPKGRKAEIEAYARDAGESVNGLVNALLREKLGQSEEEWKRGEGDGEDL